LFESANFWHFKLENFDDSQRREFIDNWCNLVVKKDKINKKRRSNKSLRKKQNIQQKNKQEGDKEKEQLKKRLLGEINKFTSISDKPQFLMMMLGILDAQDSLPSEQELYAHLSRMLLASSNENGIDRREKQVILGLIAYQMQFGSHALYEGNSIDYESLKQLLISYLEDRKFKDPRSIAVQIIEELEFYHFITCVSKKLDSEDNYNFANPKFLAYFCAREVKRQCFALSSIELIFSRYWHYENRHKSLRLICGALDEKSALQLVLFLITLSVKRVDHLEKNIATKVAIQHLWLARECLAEIKDYHLIAPKINETLKEKLINEIEDKSEILLNAEAAKILTDSIAKYYRNECDTIEWLKKIAIQNGNKFVRSAAVQSIAEYYHCKNDRDIISLLQKVATQDSDELPRRVAIRSIAEYYHTKKDLELDRWPDSRSCNDCEYSLLTWLEDCVDLDPHHLVRRESVRAIAKYYHNTSDTLEWLRDCAMQDLHAWVRQSAVQASVLYYHKQPDTLKWLQDRALDDKHQNVIRTAIESIARYHHQESETLEWLKGQANNNDELVDAAIQSIARYYHQESDTLKWLQSDLDRLNGRARKAVVASIAKYYYMESIARHYRKEDSTLKWLQERAMAYNPNQDVRLFAVKSIVKYYRKEDYTLTWLKEIAMGSDYSNVRRIAVESIAKYYYKKEEKSNPRTWLQQECVIKSKNDVVWKAALESIPKYYRKPCTLEWLQDLALNNKLYLSKRSAALQSIAKCYWDESGTEKWLKEIAGDKDISLREDAMKSIAQYYHKNPDTLEWLQERFLYKEHNPKIRVAIVESIAKYYRKKSFIFTLLKECALNDYEPLVRSASIRAINEYFPKNNEVDKILQLVIDRDLDRNIDDEEYPKAVAVQILKDKYR
jgi:HEAT repeats